VVYTLINSGELRSFKIGAARRVPVSALDEFVANRLGVGDVAHSGQDDLNEEQSSARQVGVPPPAPRRRTQALAHRQTA
jgi:hypothetical protein